MYMKDWIIRLDDFLKMTNKKILLHAGKISHDKALEKARGEYLKYKNKMIEYSFSPVEKHFLKTVKEIEKITLDDKKK